MLRLSQRFIILLVMSPGARIPLAVAEGPALIVSSSSAISTAALVPWRLQNLMAASFVGGSSIDGSPFSCLVLLGVGGEENDALASLVSNP